MSSTKLIFGIICTFILVLPSCLTNTLPYEMMKPDSWSQTEFHQTVYTYKWTISNYSLLPLDNSIVSSTFNTLGKDWCLELGIFNNSKRMLNLHLMTPENENTVVNVAMYVVRENVKDKVVQLHQENGKKFSKNVPISGFLFGIILNDTVSSEDEVQIFCRLSTVEKSLAIGENVPQENFGRSIKDDMAVLFETRDFSDIIVSAEGKDFAAHKAILAMRSKVFAIMFKPGLTQIRGNKVVIANMTYECLTEMMRFIYTGNVKNVSSVSIELLEAAGKFKMFGLKLLCGDALLRNLTVETAARVCVYGDIYKLQNVKDTAVQFIKQNLQKVRQTEGWKFMTEKHPKLVIESLFSFV